MYRKLFANLLRCFKLLLRLARNQHSRSQERGGLFQVVLSSRLILLDRYPVAAHTFMAFCYRLLAGVSVQEVYGAKGSDSQERAQYRKLELSA